MSQVPSTYEERLSADFAYAELGGGRFFNACSEIYRTLDRVVRIFRRRDFDHAVIGGIAQFMHGYRRYTENVDILVSRSNLAEIIGELIAQGFSRPDPFLTMFRDSENGVRLRLETSGQQAKALNGIVIEFPEPSVDRQQVGGMWCVSLETLIEMKLFAGMQPRGRRRHLADVQD